MQRSELHVLMSIVILLSLLLGGCGGAPASPPAIQESPVPPPAATNTAEPTSTPTETPTPEPTGTPTLTPTSTRTPGPVEITVWYSYTGAEELAFINVVKRVRKELPDYTIKVMRIPFNSIFDTYRAGVKSGEGPDMWVAPNDNLGEDASKRYLADITDLAAGKLDGVDPRAIEGLSYGGRLYGIPESMKAVALWYKKSLLPEPPRTTDELKALMEAARFPVAIAYNCYYHFGFYGSFGGRLFDENWRFTADQGGFVEGMRYLKELYDISTAHHWPVNIGDGYNKFRYGSAALITDGNWAMGDYRSALGGNLAVAPLPAGPGGPATPLLGVDGFYINPNSPLKDVAVEVALHFTDRESQQYMMEKSGHVPVRTDVEITDPLIEGLVEAFANAYVRPQVPQLGSYWNNFCSTDDVFITGLQPATWVRRSNDAANNQVPGW